MFAEKCVITRPGYVAVCVQAVADDQRQWRLAIDMAPCPDLPEWKHKTSIRLDLGETALFVGWALRWVNEATFAYRASYATVFARHKDQRSTLTMQARERDVGYVYLNEADRAGLVHVGVKALMKQTQWHQIDVYRYIESLYK